MNLTRYFTDLFTQIKNSHFLQQKLIKKPTQQAKESSKFELQLLRWQFTTKQRLRIYAKLSSFLQNGVPLIKALEIILLHLSKDGKKYNTPSAQAVLCWVKALQNGGSFAQALKGWAGVGEIAILNAGELAGKLHQSIADTLFLHETQRKIKNALMGLAYPLALVATTCFFLYIFGSQVVPAFAQILPVNQWNGAGKYMAYLAYFVQNDLVICLLCITIIMIAIVMTLPSWRGKIRFYFDFIPPWSLYKIVIGNSFLISLYALLDAGVPAPEAVSIMSKKVSPWYKEKLLAIRKALLNGAKNVGEALYIVGFHFPTTEMVIDLRAYAALDGFEAMLGKLSYQWQEQTIRKIQSQIDILRNVAIVLMGLSFMWLISGMYALEMQITNTARF